MWTKERSYVDMSIEVWTKVLTVWKRVLNCLDKVLTCGGQMLNYVDKSIDV